MENQPVLISEKKIQPPGSVYLGQDMMEKAGLKVGSTVSVRLVIDREGKHWFIVIKEAEA